MNFLSDILRTLFIALLFLLGLFGWLLPATLLLSLMGRKTTPWRHRLMWRACRFAARHLPGTQLQIEGLEHLPKEQPAVWISNHLSSLDLVCLLMLSPRLVVVTNAREWHNPLYGAIIRRLSFLPVSMGFEALQEQVGRLVREGYSVAIFPEGTRSRNGRLGRFHQGAFALAAHLHLPLLPIVLQGTDRVFPKGSRIFHRGRLSVSIHPAWPSPSPHEQSIKETRHRMRDFFLKKTNR